jgi:AcrR family transcriptional regulator
MAPKKKVDRKEAIVHEAAKLFARRGYDATGVAELGKAVGLGRGALYHHIGSKEELLFEIGTAHVREMIAYGDAILEIDAAPEDKFRRLCRRLMRTIADNLPELTVYFVEHRALKGKRRTGSIAERDRFEQTWLKLLEQGYEAGAFKTADPLAVKGILGTFNYSYLWLQPDGEKSPEEIADFFADMLLAGIAA